ncbi:MAG: (2Fe-2S)-binding protein [Alphaproteobacteria bacterium]|nr:(2Fe-2S)-binding protein [Alphaproteobacteria bacterium]
MTTQDVTLQINGRAHRLAVRLDTTLLTVLREGLALTGAKRGCNQGVCGACTVLLDGRPVRGCLTLAHDAEDRAITTIEGLGAEPNPVQAALAEAGAVQCGFCTPGMVMAATAFLRDHPAPSLEAVREGLSGNLCRCSGYRKVVEAVHRAGGGAP